LRRERFNFFVLTCFGWATVRLIMRAACRCKNEMQKFNWKLNKLSFRYAWLRFFQCALLTQRNWLEIMWHAYNENVGEDGGWLKVQKVEKLLALNSSLTELYRQKNHLNKEK
jgi:hypothetical protein